VKKISILVICFWFITSLSAQERLEFDKINIEEGLSHSSVLAMIQDSKGFIWVGTQFGLNRYDGYSFETYHFEVDNEESISSNFILSIFEDSTGLIWIGTSNGLNSYDPVTTKFTRYLSDDQNQESISNNHITSITEDQLGYIWIGTAGGGLNRLDKKNQLFQKFQLKYSNNQIAHFITDLLIDQHHDLWITSGNARLRPSHKNGGIFKLNTQSFESTQIHPQGIKENKASYGFNSVFEDSQQNIWFGSLGLGLLKKNKDSSEFNQYLNETLTNQDTILDITEDSSGTIWFATQYSGFYKFNPLTLESTNYNSQNPTKSNINDNDITSLLFDSTGVFWLGTWTDGVNKLDFDSFQFKKVLQYKSNADGHRYKILGINQDSTGKTWLAAWESGLLEFDINTGIYKKHDLEGVNKNLIIRTIYIDNDDNLWIGSNDHGLIYYNPKLEITKVYQNDPTDKYSINSNQIIDIIAEPSGNLWIATRGGGVNYFNRNEIKFYKFNKETHGIDNRVSVLLYDDYDLLWIGSFEGLYILDTKSKTLLSHYVGDQGKDSYIGNDINDIFEDKQKRIWIGTEKGFSQVLFDSNSNRETLKFKWDKETSIGSVGGILEDPHGLLWISSFKKIIQYNPETNQLTNFNSSFGVLPSGYYIGSKYLASDNTMYFGGLDGFTLFQAKDIHHDITEPKIELTKLLLFNKAVLVNDSDNSVLKQNIGNTTSVNFDYTQNVFSLEFAALHYASPKDNQYAYKLIGFDKNWNYSDSSHRRATYTNLDSGNYQFYIKASNKDGVWSQPQNKLSITVSAAPWRTKWAYLSYFILLTSIVGSFIWLRIKQVQAIKLRNEQLSLTSKLFENTSECVWLLDQNFKYLAVNEGFCKITGVNKQDIIGTRIRAAEIKNKQSKSFITGIFSSIEQSGRWSGEMWDQRTNGEVYPVEIVIDRISIVNPSKNTTEYQYVGVFSDITQRKITEENLRKMAYYDPLTGLINRSYFKILVQQEIDKKLSPGEFIVFYLDLDNFKDINDSIGHSFGDQLLIKIARRLTRLSKSEYIVARLGGDEFAIMIPNNKINISTSKLSLDFSNKILDTINKKIKLKNYNSYMTVSIGVSVYPYDASNHEELLRNADTAMYHAKKKGRNAAVLFSKSMNEDARERLMLVDELNKAIQSKEFIPYFQPKACLRTGKITGVEVLARWNNKNLGMVTPNRFIPVAEESKLITDISQQLMIKACQFILPAIDEGLFKGRISFNVSITQFVRSDFVPWIDKILGECNFPSEYLELEITESMVMENIESAIEIMKQLSSRNISISIDDFGTGYSSLSYLKKFPIDTIKIDKSFISDLMYSEEDRKIVTSIIQLAHNLGLKVIAEGTEELDQILFLKELGCEEIQGFYFCKPLAGEEYLAFLSKSVNLFKLD
jgi:diguanylate cyclase (GGDEF)-like protein/PAS domain S-box-containing protein